MKTSYFAQLKNIPEDSNVISICGKAPAWYKGRQYKKLAPKYDFFVKYTQDGNVENYTKEYQKQVLDKLNAETVYKELGEDAILICYEKPSDFCHRQLVAKWFKEKLDIEVEEFKK